MVYSRMTSKDYQTLFPVDTPVACSFLNGLYQRYKVCLAFSSWAKLILHCDINNKGLSVLGTITPMQISPVFRQVCSLEFWATTCLD